MSPAMTAYWICLAIGVGYTIISLALGGLGGHAGHGGDFGHAGNGADFSHDYGVGDQGGHGHGHASGTDAHDGEVAFGPFSPLVIAFFLTCFGAMGLLMSQIRNFGPSLVLPGALLASVLLAWLLIRFLNTVVGRLQSSSEVRVYTLIGTLAEVTVAIPASGVGEVAYVAMGQRNIAPARSEDHVDIPRSASVRIARVIGSVAFVTLSLEDRLEGLSGDPAPSTSTSTKQ